MNFLPAISWRWPVLLLVLLTGLASCVELYAPATIDAPPSLLVVDGFINAAGPTTIRLSRTAALAATATPPAETKARLLIELQNGPSYALSETEPGTYASAPLQLAPGSLCRLRISTTKGQQYASDFVPVKLTPPIDELRWKPVNNAVDMLVSTYDATGSSRYYRWETEQTWEISSPYQPNIEYIYFGNGKGAIRSITVPYPTLCWGNSQSNRIRLSQTTALNQDKVVDFRIQSLPAGAPELYSRYSLLLRQQALTQQEYNYWEQLRKNTEALGTLFDPQPTQLTGNVHNLEANAQPALGFVGAHSVTEKRLFISSQELPEMWPRRSGYENCVPPDTVFIASSPLDAVDIEYGAFGAQGLIPIVALTVNSRFIGYLAKQRDCVDCRTRGTNVKPSFW